MKRIAVLSCWYCNRDKFPWYFSYFLHSCGFNKTIDYLIFSDIQFESAMPDNVKLINLSRNELKMMASKKIGFEVAINFPYKICDFRPAFGKIFEDYLVGYDYWAHGDIDIIYGNLRNFLTDDLLNSVQFISVQPDFIRGCFAVYKNEVYVNTFFTRGKDYKKVFSTNEFLGFDELNHKRSEILRFGRRLDEIETDIESFTHIIKKAQAENKIRAYFDCMIFEGRPGQLKFDHGEIIYKKKYEAALYHLHFLKRIYHPKYIRKQIPDVYFISQAEIYNRSIK